MSLPARALRKAQRVCAPHLTPIGGFFRYLKRRSLAIAMYHGVTNEQTALPDWCQVRTDDFRWQMEFLRNEYSVLPLGEAIDFIARGRSLPDRAVCLTFDDGFRNVMTDAAPILKANQLPSTVFLVTSLLDTCLPPWPGRLLYTLSITELTSIRFDGVEWQLLKGRAGLPVYAELVDRIKKLPGGEREAKLEVLIGGLGGGRAPDYSKSPRATMNWDEVAALAGDGLMRFESHTHTHASLANCSSEEQRSELETSRDMLRERLPSENLFCYPFGDHSAQTRKIVAEAGYRCALTTESGINPPSSDVYSLRRAGVGAGMPRAEFEFAMLGWY